jgi:hypothetical protein
MNQPQPIENDDGDRFVDETFASLKRHRISAIGFPFVFLGVGTGLLLFNIGGVNVAAFLLAIGAFVAVFPTRLFDESARITSANLPIPPALRAKFERLTTIDVSSLGPHGNEVAEFLASASALDASAVERLRFSNGWRRIAIVNNIASYRALDDRHDLLRLIRPTPSTEARAWIEAEGLRWKYPIDVHQTLVYAALAIVFRDVLPTRLTTALLVPTLGVVRQ